MPSRCKMECKTCIGTTFRSPYWCISTIESTQLLTQQLFKFREFWRRSIIISMWQDPWFTLCATCVEPTLGLLESKGVWSKTPCDMVRWVFNLVQVCTGMVFYCLVSTTNHLWWEVGRGPNVLELLCIWTWERGGGLTV
jgi:hypothetical protein